MTRPYLFWKENEVNYLLLNYGKISVAAICEEIGKSRNAVINKAERLKLSRSRGRPWKEIETEYLQENYLKISTQEISSKLGRSIGSIEARVYILRLCSNKCRPWEVEETDLLNNYGGVKPISQIKTKLDKLCNERGWSTRSNIAIKTRLQKIGESIKGDVMSLNQIESVLHCSRSSLLRWLNTPEYAKILKPESNDFGTWIEVKNLRNFAIECAGEFARFRPDIIWLIQLCSKS